MSQRIAFLGAGLLLLQACAAEGTSPTGLPSGWVAPPSFQLRPVEKVSADCLVYSLYPPETGGRTTVCSRDHASSYVVGKAFATADDVSSAEVAPPESSRGIVTVIVTLDEDATRRLAEMSKGLAELAPPRNEAAIVVGSDVQTTLVFSQPILSGRVVVSGFGDLAEAEQFAANLI